MYVCEAEKCEVMVFFFVFFYSSFDRQFSAVAGEKNPKMNGPKMSQKWSKNDLKMLKKW